MYVCIYIYITYIYIYICISSAGMKLKSCVCVCVRWGVCAAPNVERLMSELGREEQRESAYIFDNEVMECGMPLSELYLALLKLQLEDAATISHQYEEFRARKAAYLARAAEKLRLRNRKLKLIRYALHAAATGAADSDIEALGFTSEAFKQIQQNVDELITQQKHLKETLNRLKNEPDSYQGEDLEVEWIDDNTKGDADANKEEEEETDKTLQEDNNQQTTNAIR